jgi:hypothetical protein
MDYYDALKLDASHFLKLIKEKLKYYKNCNCYIICSFLFEIISSNLTYRNYRNNEELIFKLIKLLIN